MFRFFNDHEIASVYPALFEEFFGKVDVLQAPSVVGVIEEDNEILAFISGYWVNRAEFYIQYSSISQKVRNKKLGMGYLMQAMDGIGAVFYITMIPNDNIPAMKVVMDCGFKLIGIRQPTDGTILGEWLKEVN